MDASELLKSIMPRLNGPTAMPFLDALNLSIKAVTDRLHMAKSSHLRVDFEDDFLAGATSVDLSDNFIGFYTHPWIDGQTATLIPLPSGIKHTFADDGTPIYFEERNRKLYLYPIPSEAGTLVAETFEKPDAIDSLSDDIPFNGDYDAAIAEIMLFVLRIGSMATIDPAFEAFVRSQVDAPSHRRIKKGITWQYPA